MSALTAREQRALEAVRQLPDHHWTREDWWRARATGPDAFVDTLRSLARKGYMRKLEPEPDDPAWMRRRVAEYVATSKVAA